jgi:hypothetical protein
MHRACIFVPPLRIFHTDIFCGNMWKLFHVFLGPNSLKALWSLLYPTAFFRDGPTMFPGLSQAFPPKLKAAFLALEKRSKCWCGDFALAQLS